MNSIPTQSRARAFSSLLLILSLLAAPGCHSHKYLMPTPNIYTHPDWNPFADVPQPLQSNTVSLLYVTDRAPTPTDEPSDLQQYGHQRSRSAAFGQAVVQFGKDYLSWDDLTHASRAKKRPKKIQLNVTAAYEVARFAETPPNLILTDAQLSADEPPPPDPDHVEAERRFLEALTTRLALTPRKEVFIYVHGFSNSFNEALMTTAELWHFLGREGVPLCYTWPAGSSSLRAYWYTVASTEFTIHHFKQTIRLIASCPDVKKIHIIAHSRGTAVTTDTLRELHLELRNTTDTSKSLKLGTVVLAAADIDFDVMIARNTAEQVGRAIELRALYISRGDTALNFSGWLFGGLSRLGRIDPKIFSKEEIAALRASHRLQLIDARVKGHSYFQDNPAVSSDFLLLLRYQIPPGMEYGRPLSVTDAGLWALDNQYPGANWSLPTTNPHPE